MGIALLAVAASLLLLALAPRRAAYSFGPRVGTVLDHGRLAFAGVGAAVGAGVLLALVLGGAA